MKQFSYANTYNAYLSAVLLTFCSTAVLYPRDRSECKPASCAVFNMVEPRDVPACDSFKKCLKPLLNKQTEQVIAACQESCDQSIPFSSPIIITEPGRYCLLADLEVSEGPAITVAPNVTNVILDLNNHVISSSINEPPLNRLIEVQGNNKNITILNGTIQPLGTNTQGINVVDSEGVVLRNLLIKGNNVSGTTRGINITNVTDVKIKNCSLTQIGFRPLELNSCSVGKITCCSFFGNVSTSNLLSLESCTNILCEEINCSNNEGNPTASNQNFRMNQSSNIVLSRCTASNNINRRFGFLIQGSSGCVLDRCEASNNVMLGSNANNSEGIATNTANGILFEACVANNNKTEGMGSEAAGFRLLNADRSIVQNCIANKNDSTTGVGYGFNTLSGTIFALLRNNIALDNKTVGFRRAQSARTVDFHNFAQGNLENYTVTPNTNPDPNAALLATTAATYSLGVFPVEDPLEFSNISAIATAVGI